jgi:hypothetical protein
MNDRDTVAVVLLLMFICWLLAIIIGMKIVNTWVCASLTCYSCETQLTRSVRPKRCMIPDGLTTDFERKILIRILRADARAGEAAERAERAEAVTVTITATESEDD